MGSIPWELPATLNLSGKTHSCTTSIEAVRAYIELPDAERTWAEVVFAAVHLTGSLRAPRLLDIANIFPDKAMGPTMAHRANPRYDNDLDHRD